MSARPAGPDSGLQRLLDDGYEAEVREQHLMVHSVPYVTSSGAVSRGTLVCTYVENAGSILPPDNHQVWWTGEYPCFADRTPISQVANESGQRELFPGFVIQHRFSNKPDGVSNFVDHYSKVVHYVTLLQSQAKVLDPRADARTQRTVHSEQQESPFVYADSASARAEIQLTSSRLALRRVAIIGVGGTGSYILDQIAKTPVREIHLYDGDVFLQHNAFRSPGAATVESLAAQMPKTEYFRKLYSAMHKGIISHPHFITDENIGEITDFDFAFVCVDQGSTRSVLFSQLISQRIPFVDVGMNLDQTARTSKLLGTCRYTLYTPGKSDHLAQYAPLQEDADDALYRQNIQVADMNAINAQLAVMKWKQYFGFYQDDFGAHNGTFSVNTMSLTRDALDD